MLLLVLWMLFYGIYLLATGQTDHGVFLIVIGGGGLLAVGGGALRLVGAKREKGFFAAIRAAVWPSASDEQLSPASAQPQQAPERRKGRKRSPKKPQ